MRHYSRLLCGAAAIAILTSAGAAHAETKAQVQFDIPAQPLTAALNQFGIQSGSAILFKADVTGAKVSRPLAGAADPEMALAMMLDGTGLSYRREGQAFVIVSASDPQSAGAAGDGADGTVQALVVTAQKREENIQDVPIAMSAFTQEDLTRSQVAGGPDLMTQVPNFTFTKTNFSSYSIQIRGIGTQAISATTDAAVAVAENNTPFIRNRFFEQEFYDLERVEVLRGPQGTLYGRNATAGVVNIITAKPKFTYGSRLSLDVGNYGSHRLEGMLNLPLAEDKVALRIAGAWTKRDGYDVNQITGNRIDGRDLWSARASLRLAPTDAINANLIWEHFEENDDRLRSGKQLCHQDDRQTLGNLTVDWSGYGDIYSQGCLPASLYSTDSYEAPNGFAMPYYTPLGVLGLPIRHNFNPYASLVQSSNLRVIESTLEPEYKAKTDVAELQWTYDMGDNLTLTSETAYLHDTIFSFEDFNRFNTERGAFENDELANTAGYGDRQEYITPGDFGGVFCDPQLGCQDRLVAADVSRAKSSQFSQEFRLSSDYGGPFNFSLGANFLRYDTMEKYYVFINTLTMLGASGLWGNFIPLPDWQPGVSDNHECMARTGFVAPNPATIQPLAGCRYIDPNPIESLNDQGHNYFLSKNPYKLISYAVFGEAYYNLAPNLKLTAGLRWTVDKKEAPRIPSMLLAADSVGLSVLTVEDQEWREPTGRLALDWKPALSFTDQTLLYASYARGYKAGGSNPPPAGIIAWSPEAAELLLDQSIAKPKTFDPEFVNAFELGAKNTLMDGRVTLNLAGFYYDYRGYQISQIIDRSAANYNFDAKVWGLEVEADWRPVENLRLGFKGGYEHTRIADGERAIDIMDRTAGQPGWIVVRPFPTFSSNCVLPLYVFDKGENYGKTFLRYPLFSNGFEGPCEQAYLYGNDPVTMLPYVPNPTLTSDNNGGAIPMSSAIWDQQFANYPGFDPHADYGNNHGEGFFKELGGNELPNAPHFTATITADYTLPLPSNWLMTLHSDLYYQSEAWTRVFNTPGYDKLKAYNNVNIAAIFTNDEAGWKIMAYIKNVFDKDNITGAFLNSDDTGLTTNVFLNEPRLYGLRVTKEWTGGSWSLGGTEVGPQPFVVELGGSLQRHDADYDPVVSAGPFTPAVNPAASENQPLDWGEGGELKLTYAPSSLGWRVSAGVRYGKTKGVSTFRGSEQGDSGCLIGDGWPIGDCSTPGFVIYATNWLWATITSHEKNDLLDFQVGRDFGLGSGFTSTVSVGLRFADLTSTTRLQMNGVPDGQIPDQWAAVKYSTHDYYDTDLTGRRTFKGLGPMVSWDGSKTLAGDDARGRLDAEVSLSAGVLFGRQKTSVEGRELVTYYSESHFDPQLPVRGPTSTGQPAARSHSATVPVFGASVGLAYKVGRVGVRTGYRWDKFSNVLDAGFSGRREFDRTIDGPYLKIAVGFGG